MSAPFTIIVPAHNEERVIAATLEPWARADDVPQVIVVCNACTDATAATARRALPRATLIETDRPGKANAINLGLAAAPAGAVLIVDADIGISPESLRALAATLDRPGVSAVSPGATFALTEADRVVRAYYRAFAAHPYLTGGVGASGVYGVSVEGRSRLGRLPEIMSDDDYVRHFFDLSEQRRVTIDPAGRAVTAIVHPPQNWPALIRTEARWRAGDHRRRSGSIVAGNLARTWLDRRVGVAPMAAYMTVKLAGRALYLANRLRGVADHWYRDDSSRGDR